MYVVYSSLQTDSPIMLINQHVGYTADEGMGCSGAEFQRELLELDGGGYKRIQVWINSPGGVVMDGYNMYNAILKTKTPVDTYCIGIAGSIMAVVFQAGRKRIMSDYGQLMFHNPSGGDDKKALDSITSSLVTMIASRSGKTEQDVQFIMNRTSWLDAEQSLEAGLCDIIERSSDQNIRHGNAKAFWKHGNEIINSILKIENNMEGVQAKVSLSLIANYLGLNSEATENSILTEVKNRINVQTLAAEKAESRIKEITDSLSTVTKEKDALNIKYEAKVKELKDVNDKIVSDAAAAALKIKDAEEAAAKVKAEAMVKGHVTAGRIKNNAETIEKWTAKAVIDFDGVDSLLKDLPVNKTATVITIQKDGTTVDPSQVSMNATVLMAKVQNNLKKEKA